MEWPKILARISKSLLDDSRRNKTGIMAASNACGQGEEKSMGLAIESKWKSPINTE